MFQPSNKLKTNCASVDSGHRKMLSKSAPGSRAELGSVGFGLEFPNFHGEIMENSWKTWENDRTKMEHDRTMMKPYGK